MSLPETKVMVTVLKDGRWAQEAWLPQLVVVKGDVVSISISIAYALEKKGKCRIISDASEDGIVDSNDANNESAKSKEEPIPTKVKKKSAKGDKKGD